VGDYKKIITIPGKKTIRVWNLPLECCKRIFGYNEKRL
jgi:hypothetical protein